MHGRVFVAVALLASACAPQSALQGSTASDDFAVAQEQAVALGHVLGDVQACDGDAWQPPFHEFMAAKRKRGLDGSQTAMIATLVGTAQYRSDAMIDCSEDSRAKRVAALEELRVQW